ncbi:MAG: hypothetical protein LUE16_06205 [Lachnospiraceae bacterium]|nr:hypothetical protein [Lachnospiraceae bacterium]
MGGSVKRFTACLLALCLLTSQLGISLSDGVIVSAEDTQTVEESTAVELLTDENNENETAATADAAEDEITVVQSAADFIAEDAVEIAAAGSLEEEEDAVNLDSQVDSDVTVDESSEDAAPEDGTASDEENIADAEADSDGQDASEAENIADAETDSDGQDASAEENTADAEAASDEQDVSDEENSVDAEAASDEQDASDEENTVDAEADSDEQDASDGEASVDATADDDAAGEDSSDEEAVDTDAESTDEETSADLESEEAVADSLTTEDEEALEEKEKEPVTYTAETSNGIVVSVVAQGGVLPDDVTLVASLIGSNEDESASAVGDALDNHDISYDGYVAIDVHFEDETGTEVEPDGAVAVSFSLPEGLLPEGAQNLEAQHLKEDGNGNVTEVETVAAENDGSNSVSVADDGSVVAEFEVGCFSTFTITIKYNHSSTNTGTLSVDCIDINGVGLTLNGLEIELDRNTHITVNETTSPSAWADAIENEIPSEYVFSYAVFSDNQSDAAEAENTSYLSVLSYNTSGWRFKIGSSNSWIYPSDDEIKDKTLYFVYSKATASLPVTYYSAATGTTSAVSEEGTLTLNAGEAISTSTLNPSPTETSFAELTPSSIVIAASETDATTSTVVPTYLYCTNSTWYYYTASDTPSVSNVADEGSDWTAFGKDDRVYFIYPALVSFSVTLVYWNLTKESNVLGSNTYESEAVNLSLVADESCQINKMGDTVEALASSDGYYSGKMFSYAVNASDSAAAVNSNNKVTWIKYDSANQVFMYSTDDETNTNISYTAFDDGNGLYYLYFSQDATLQTKGTNVDTTYTQTTHTWQADNAYSASDLMDYWADAISGYSISDVQVLVNGDYTSVARVMYGTAKGEYVTTSGWYYKTNDNGSFISCKIEDVYLVYTKNDIAVAYNDGSSTSNNANYETGDDGTEYSYPTGGSVNDMTLNSTAVASGDTTCTLENPATTEFTQAITQNSETVYYKYVWNGWTFATSDEDGYASKGITLTPYDSSSSTGQTLTVPESVTVDNDKINVYSSYTISEVYTVTYQWEDESKVPSDVISDVTLPKSESYSENENITLMDFTSYQEGTEVVTDGVTYTWLGWYGADNNAVDDSYIVTGNVTLTGKWKAEVNVSLKLVTNFALDSSNESAALKNYFENSFLSDSNLGDVKSTTAASVDFQSSISGTIETKQISASTIGTTQVGDTIILPARKQGTKITVVDGSDSYTYLFGGWQICFDGVVLDMDQSITDWLKSTSTSSQTNLSNAQGSGYTDSSTGLTFQWKGYDSSNTGGYYYITVPKGEVTIRSALFKESNDWTAYYDNDTANEKLLYLERTSVDFTTTDAKSTYLADIEVYLWDSSTCNYTTGPVAQYTADEGEEFYFSYDSVACVDLILTPQSGYSITKVAYTVCYGSSGPGSTGWYADSDSTSKSSNKTGTADGKDVLYLDNVQETCTLKVYLTKLYSVDYQILDGTTGNSVDDSVTGNDVATINNLSPVPVEYDIEGCNLGDSSKDGHDNCTADNSSTAVDYSISGKSGSSGFYYSLNSEFSFADPELNSAALYSSINGWYYNYKSISDTGTKLTSGTYDLSTGSLDNTLGNTIKQLIASATSGNVIMLTSLVYTMVVPTDFSVDSTPYLVLFGTGTVAGVLLLAAGWKRKRRRRVLRGELDRYSHERRDRRNEW